jgi:hypothetical protein
VVAASEPGQRGRMLTITAVYDTSDTRREHVQFAADFLNCYCYHHRHYWLFGALTLF